VRNHLIKQDIIVLIFRTNIEPKDMVFISTILNKIHSIDKWNTDLEDSIIFLE
jgi:hypothetical protein